MSEKEFDYEEFRKENKNISMEQFARKLAEATGKEFREHVIDGVTHYTIGKPDIKRWAEVALREIENMEKRK